MKTARLLSHIAHLGLVAAAGSLAACSSTSNAVLDPDASGADAGVPDAPDVVRFQRCVGAEFTPEPAGSFNSPINATIATGTPFHSSQDVVTTPDAAPTVRAQFSYSILVTDIEGETIKAWLWDCQSWRPLGEATTDVDGRVAIPVTGTLPIGVYDVRFEVVGDATVTGSTVWVLPAGTHLVVSDIDGTLTTSDGELFRQILDGSYVPEAYPGAAALIDAHADHGQIPLFLTGRPFPLTERTRDWLGDLDFPLGPLHVTNTFAEAAPTEGGVGTFKKTFLTALQAAGFVIDLAYGNATTDIFAYLGAGIAADHAWIIGPNAGQQGTNAVMDSWEPRAAEVAAEAPVEQPFAW